MYDIVTKKKKTYAFLDQGSTHTFCDRKLIESLCVTKNTSKLRVQTLTSVKELNGFSCSLKILPLDADDEYCLSNVFSLENIPIQPNLVPARNELDSMEHLRDLEFPRLAEGDVKLLIGADMPELFLPSSIRKGHRVQPVAVKTPLGWSLLGPSLSPSMATNGFVGLVNSKNELLRSQIRSLWETDFQPEASSGFDVPNSREDRISLELFKTSVVQVSGHYQLPLPWKPGVKDLPDNLSLAYHRLNSLKRRFLKDHELHEKYSITIDSYVEKGYAKLVQPDQLGSKENRVWYLPHHPVYQPLKGKTRIVFDCAAKQAGESLNDSLMSGPDLMNSLVGVLIRFRKEPVALVAYIESMFHQVVLVNSPDCDALRFLWWPHGNLQAEAQSYQMLVHIFGTTSSPSCAGFCLKQTALDYGKLYNPFISEIVNENFYVDDCLVSVGTESHAVMVVHQLTSLLAKGGFRLTKWLTNNKIVLATIPESERSKSLQKLDLSSTSNDRVLGIKWNFEADIFSFSVNLPKSILMSRRGILSMISSIFDPLGFIAPVMLSSKLLLQELCREGFSWDDPISESHRARWKCWVDSLPQIEKLQIKRCFKPKSFERPVCVQLHHFSDASQLAYGTCSYLRLVNENGFVHCSFLIGKSRLAPLKTVSIPRLELTAAVLAVKLDSMLRKKLKVEITATMFWSDSTAVLQILANSTKRFPTFVANRIATIERMVSPNSSWRHVPTQLNPADLASRGLTAENLVNDQIWLQAPDYLWNPEDC